MPVSATTALVTTLFYGLFLYLAFSEIRDFGKSKLSPMAVGKIAYRAFKYTTGISKSLIKLVFKDFPHLAVTIKNNIMDAFDVKKTFQSQIKGEYFFAGSLAYLMMGKFEYLNGPFGRIYLDAWRKAFPTQLGDEASPEQIKDLINSYDTESLDKVLQNINSKFFEILQVIRENADGDEWSAELIDVQNNKASDVIFTNNTTNEVLEANYKNSTNLNYIESHIQEYPDIPVIAPKEIQEKINSPFVSHVDTETVDKVTSENFEKLINQYSNIDVVIGTSAVGAASYVVRLTPFLFAYYRSNITRDELGQAINKFFPDIASRTVNRIAMLTFFGPLYGVFILSSFAMRGTLYGFDEENKKEADNEDEPELKKEGILKKKFSRRSLFTLSYLREF